MSSSFTKEENPPKAISIVPSGILLINNEESLVLAFCKVTDFKYDFYYCFKVGSLRLGGTEQAKRSVFSANLAG